MTKNWRSSILSTTYRVGTWSTSSGADFSFQRVCSIELKCVCSNSPTNQPFGVTVHCSWKTITAPWSSERMVSGSLLVICCCQGESSGLDRHIVIKIQGIRPDNILFLIHEVFEGLVNESFFGVTYDIAFPCPDCLESVGKMSFSLTTTIQIYSLC